MIRSRWRGRECPRRRLPEEACPVLSVPPWRGTRVIELALRPPAWHHALFPTAEAVEVNVSHGHVLGSHRHGQRDKGQSSATPVAPGTAGHRHKASGDAGLRQHLAPPRSRVPRGLHAGSHVSRVLRPRSSEGAGKRGKPRRGAWTPPCALSWPRRATPSRGTSVVPPARRGLDDGPAFVLPFALFFIF